MKHGLDFEMVLFLGLGAWLLYEYANTQGLSQGLIQSVNPMGLTMDQYPTGTLNVGPQPTPTVSA